MQSTIRPSGTRTARPTPWRHRLSESMATVVLCGPAVVVYTAFMVLPALLGFLFSLTNWTGWRLDPQFIGLANFREIAQDERFFRTIRFTLFETALIVLFFTLGSLLLAVLLDKLKVLKGLVRGLFFYPFILSILVCALLFQYLANYRTGLLNTLLRDIGLGTWAQDWMMDPYLAPYFIFALVAWGGLGFYTTLYLANLQAIPIELYEAASLDGAGAWTVFRRIQLPLLVPTITTNSVLALITGINLFAPIVVTTMGGPSDKTFTVGYYIYWLGILNNRQGYAAAVSFVVFVALVIIAVLQVALLRRKEVEL